MQPHQEFSSDTLHHALRAGPRRARLAVHAYASCAALHARHASWMGAPC